MTIYQNTTLDYLQHSGLLSERAFSALGMMGIRTAGQLMEHKMKGRLNRHNLSLEVMIEIKALFDKLENGEIALLPLLDNEVLIGGKEQYAFNRAYALIAYENISKHRGATADLVREIFPDARTMCDAILNRTYNVLTVHPDLGRTGNMELRRLLLYYLKVMHKYILQVRPPDEAVLSTVKELVCLLEVNISTFDNEVILHDFLSTHQRRELTRLLGTMSGNLSVEARAFQREYLPTMMDIMKLFGLPEAAIAERYSFMPCRNVLHDIWLMVQTFEEAFMDEAYSDKDVRLQARIVRSFPWLSAADRRYVFRYHQENDAAPLFFVMLQLLRTSRERELEVYATVNGAGNGQRHTLEEIGRVWNLTRERVRQLYEKGRRILRDTIEQFISWSDYSSLLDSNYITALSPKYRMIQEEELLPQDFGVFLALLSALGDFEIIHIGSNTVAVHKRLRPYVYVKHIRNQLNRLSQERRSEDAVFDLRSLVADVPIDLREDAFWIVCQLAQTYTDIPFDEDWKVAIKQNYVDIPNEMFDILESNKKPMSLEALFKEFKRRNPYHKYTEPEQLKLWILRHEHIKPVGKTGTYGLAMWNHVYYGNIRDLLRQTLEASPYPMHIEKLTNIVKRYFPTTNARSIATSMSQEGATDFVAFQGGYFGLSFKTYSPKYKVTGEERRYTFAERLKMIAQFISTYHRFPYSSGSDTEQSLQRWLYNAENKQIELTSSQKGKLKTILQTFRDAHLPENKIEEDFLEMCQRYRAYIEHEYELPTRKGNLELYDWMNRSKANYNSYIDNRRHYLTELFNYINSLGFNI